MGFWPAAAEDLVERNLSHASVRMYRGQPETLVELLERAVREHPQRPAVTEVGGRTLSYEQLWEETERLAGGFQQEGVSPGDRIAILMANSVDLVLAVVAAWRAGAVAVTLNTKYTTAEFERPLRESGAALLVAAEEFWPKAGPVAPAATVLAGDISRLSGSFDPPALSPEDPALLMYTSGTTAGSKGALQSHLNVATAAETFARCLPLEPEDSTVVAAPIFHVTGLNGQALPVWSLGGTVTILPRFDADRLAAMLADGAATFLHAAPTIYVMTLRAARGRRARGLRVCVSGGSFVTRELIAETRVFAPGADFRISYGMTETSSPAVLTPPGYTEARPGDAAGVAVPVDDVAVSNSGEILFRGATVIATYDRDADADARSFADGWLRSGDLGEIDDDGFVTVLDRIKDVVNRGGEKIPSLEVEAVLSAHPAVREAAVVPKPDPVYGEVPMAVVAADGVGADELIAFARERLARFKVPVEVAFVDALPRNPGGKVLKKQLRRSAAEG